MDFVNEILDSIEIIVKQTVSDKSTKIYTGICKSANSNGVCELDINGKANTVRYYGGTPKLGEIYRVFVPSNNMSTAFIIVPTGGGGSSVTAVTSYNDLTDKPSVNNIALNGNKTSADLGLYGTNNTPPYPVTSVNNKTGDITLTASDVGALSNDTIIPTANDAILTIQENGTSVGTFSANASSNKTVNITVPTNNNELTNGAGYITETALSPYAKSDDIPTKTSDLTNDSGYITDSALATYAKTDDLPTKTSDLTNDSNYITSSDVPVQSVNAKTGIVVLTQDDIGDGTTYVRTHNDFTDALKQQINTNEDNIAMIDSDIGELETDVSNAKSEIDSLKTALTSKQDAITGAASTVVDDNLTASKVIISNASGKIATSDITTTQLDYLKNPVTSVNGQTGAVVIDADLSTALKLTGGTMQGVINMGGYKITNVATPTNNTDAANKAYADAQKGVEVLTQSAQPTDQVNGDMWFQTT